MGITQRVSLISWFKHDGLTVLGLVGEYKLGVIGIQPDVITETEPDPEGRDALSGLPE